MSRRAMAKTAAPPARALAREDRSLKRRAKDLAAKSLSIKVIVLAVATGLLIWGKIDTWTWFGVAGIVITGRFIEKKFLNGGS